MTTLVLKSLNTGAVSAYRWSKAVTMLLASGVQRDKLVIAMQQVKASGSTIVTTSDLECYKIAILEGVEL